MTESPTLAAPPVARSSVRVPLEQPGLEIHLRTDPNGPVIAREPVLSSDILDLRHEAWLECRLRRGVMESSPDGLPIGLFLIPDKSSPTRCQGFAMEMPGPDGGLNSAVFSFHSLGEVARRAISRLASSPGANPEDSYLFDLHIDGHREEEGGGEAVAPGAGWLNASLTRRPLHYLRVPLASLLERATASIPFPDLPLQRNPFPVFYTRDVLRQAEEFSRKGAIGNAQFESGAVLAGCLCSCPETGEFFVVVLAAFEVMEADQTLVSLAYSGESWARIQSVLRARQKAQPYFRMVGQVHGHNFLPNNGQTCADCLSRPHCTSSNLFASSDDQTWSRAVFSQQPWHLCHIFGLTARGDLINGLFTLRDGRLSHRGYHILPDFDPESYPNLTAVDGLPTP